MLRNDLSHSATILEKSLQESMELFDRVVEPISTAQSRACQLYSCYIRLAFEGRSRPLSANILSAGEIYWADRGPGSRCSRHFIGVG
jgi:hypothetical protein